MPDLSEEAVRQQTIQNSFGEKRMQASVRLRLDRQAAVQLQWVECTRQPLGQHFDHIHLSAAQALVFGTAGIAGAG
jgi:hypothetical protein